MSRREIAKSHRPIARHQQEPIIIHMEPPPGPHGCVFLVWVGGGGGPLGHRATPHLHLPIARHQPEPRITPLEPPPGPHGCDYRFGLVVVVAS